MFILETEVALAAEAFAVKFADIETRHEVLFGKDYFTDLEIPLDALKFRVRQVLANQILRLRESYVLNSAQDEQLSRIIAGVAGPLRAAAVTLLKLQGRSAPSPKEALQMHRARSSGHGMGPVLLAITKAREGVSLVLGRGAERVLLDPRARQSDARRCEQIGRVQMNPFDWTGPWFLLFYLVLGVFSYWFVYFYVTYRERQQPVPKLKMSDPFQIAFLRGGENEAIRIASLSLIDRGLLRIIDASSKTPKLETTYPREINLGKTRIERALLKLYRVGQESSVAFSDPECKHSCGSYQELLGEHRLVRNAEIIAGARDPDRIARHPSCRRCRAQDLSSRSNAAARTSRFSSFSRLCWCIFSSC